MTTVDPFLPVPRMRALDPDRDAEALHAVLGDPDSCRYLPRPACATVDDTRAQLRAWTAGHEDVSWATVDERDRATGRFAMYSPQEGVWEAACLVVPAARGQGLALRALPFALDHVFATRSPRRVQVDIDPENLASIRTFERLGFHREGLLRATYLTHIGVRDSVVMSLLPSDSRPWLPAR